MNTKTPAATRGARGIRRRAAELAAADKADKGGKTICTWACRLCPVILQRPAKHKLQEAASNHLANRHPGARTEAIEKAALVRKVIRSTRDKARSKIRSKARKGKYEAKSGLGFQQTVIPSEAVELPEELVDWQCPWCEKALPVIPGRWLREISRTWQCKGTHKKTTLQAKKALTRKGMLGKRYKDGWKAAKMNPESKAFKNIQVKFEGVQREASKLGHTVEAFEIKRPESACRRKKQSFCTKCRKPFEAVSQQKAAGVCKQFIWKADQTGENYVKPRTSLVQRWLDNGNTFERIADFFGMQEEERQFRQQQLSGTKRC